MTRQAEQTTFRHTPTRWLATALAASWLAGCTGSVVFDPARRFPAARSGQVSQGPSARAQAHGFHRTFQYRYWARQDVYYDLQNHQYVWFEQGGWRVGAALPAEFHVNPDGGMLMETQSPLPWLDRQPSDRGRLAGYYR